MLALPLVCLCVLIRTGAAAAARGLEVMKVEQDGDAMLPCSLGNKQNMESGLFHWKKVAHGDQLPKEVFFYEAPSSHYNSGLDGQSDQFKGRVAFFPDELKHGNASIVIRNTKMADAGNYTCAFPRLQTPQTFYVELIVGASPRPSVTSLDDTESWSRLQCEAHGSPAPVVQWEASSGRLLPAQEVQRSQRGSSFYVTVSVTVNQTDRYRCVATQKDLNHRVQSDISIYIGGAAQEPVVKRLDETKEWAWLQCVVSAASPDLRVEWEDSSGKRLVTHKPVFPVGGASDDIILNITVTQTGRYRCVSTDRTNKRSEAETYVYIAGSSGWTNSIVVAVVAFLGGVLLVVVVLAVKRCIKQSRTDSSGNKDATKETNALTGTSEEG